MTVSFPGVQLGDGRPGSQRQALWQSADGGGHGHGAGAGRGLPGDQAQQRRLAGAVVADQAGAAGAERAREVLQDRGPVGPCAGQPGQGDGGAEEVVMGLLDVRGG